MAARQPLELLGLGSSPGGGALLFTDRCAAVRRWFALTRLSGLIARQGIAPVTEVGAMTARASLVFVCFSAAVRSRLPLWSGHAGRVFAAAGRSYSARIPGADDAWVWSLVSGNNRQLARGASVHPTLAAARRDAGRMLRSRELLAVELVTGTERARYGWFATVGGHPVATCARWYPTDRDRNHSLDLALNSMGTVAHNDLWRVIALTER